MKNCLKGSAALLASLFFVLFLLSGATASAEATAKPQLAAYTLPQVSQIQAQSSSSITYFRATASRMRGRIDLSWYYTGKAFSGYFVVERSSNGSAWRSVSACTLKYNGNAKTPYTCSDTGLASGTTYAYRACIVAKGTACSAASATKAVTVKAP